MNIVPQRRHFEDLWDKDSSHMSYLLRFHNPEVILDYPDQEVAKKMHSRFDKFNSLYPKTSSCRHLTYWLFPGVDLNFLIRCTYQIEIRKFLPIHPIMKYILCLCTTLPKILVPLLGCACYHVQFNPTFHCPHT